MNEILKVQNLNKIFKKKTIFKAKSHSIIAANNVSFSLNQNEILAIAGQSGSGKSTIAKLILRALTPDSGKIFFNGEQIIDDSSSLKNLRMQCQMVYQDPYDSINPRMRISDIINEPLEIHNIGNKKSRNEIVLNALQQVRLEPASDLSLIHI